MDTYYVRSNIIVHIIVILFSKAWLSHYLAFGWRRCAFALYAIAGPAKRNAHPLILFAGAVTNGSGHGSAAMGLVGLPTRRNTTDCFTASNNIDTYQYMSNIYSNNIKTCRSLLTSLPCLQFPRVKRVHHCSPREMEADSAQKPPDPPATAGPNCDEMLFTPGISCHASKELWRRGETKTGKRPGDYTNLHSLRVSKRLTHSG